MHKGRKGQAATQEASFVSLHCIAVVVASQDTCEINNNNTDREIYNAIIRLV